MPFSFCKNKPQNLMVLVDQAVDIYSAIECNSYFVCSSKARNTRKRVFVPEVGIC